MRWQVHGERIVYESEWMSLALTDVELPDGTRFDHHVLRMPVAASGVVVHRDDEVLMLWRHRFATDTWGWEIPAGRIELGEDPVDAGRRETLEETGWRPGPLSPLATYYPLNGSSDATFHLFRADGATPAGRPSDPHEAERVEWRPWGQVEADVAQGRVRDGMSLTGLLLYGARRHAG